MKRPRILWKVIKRLHFNKVLYVFLAWFVAVAVIVLIAEPEITRLGDALWYLFVASTSIGFGDFVAVTFLGRLLTVITTIYEILLVAMFSGIVVSYYLEVLHRREQEILMTFLHKMEHLSELSPEKLKEIEDKIKKIE